MDQLHAEYKLIFVCLKSRNGIPHPLQMNPESNVCVLCPPCMPREITSHLTAPPSSVSMEMGFTTSTIVLNCRGEGDRAITSITLASNTKTLLTNTKGHLQAPPHRPMCTSDWLCFLLLSLWQYFQPVFNELTLFENLMNIAALDTCSEHCCT